MLDKIKHVNSQNEVIEINKDSIFLNYNDLRDFEWSASTSNNKINKFSKGVTTKSLPFIIKCIGEVGASCKNNFFEHFEVDIINNKKGYFEINGYKFYCYAKKSKKTQYLIDDGMLYVTLEVITDQDTWVREHRYLINTGTSMGKNGVGIKKYDYKYSYIYRNSIEAINVVNDAVGLSDVIIRMFGPCTNPFVKIGETIYQMNASLDNGEYFEINTETRTIVKIGRYGERTNAFMNRSMNNPDFFKKIPQGTSIATWGGFEVGEIIIVEKRSEPKWM